LLTEHRGVRNKIVRRPLTINQILEWCDAHKERTGRWPSEDSGSIAGQDETWNAIAQSLRGGCRHLPGGTSLAKLLAEQRGHRNRKALPKLTIEQILIWADAHMNQTGDWPRVKSGQVADTNETWANINNALQKGQRGLPGGSSLARLFAEHLASSERTS
jgi:hypothetical protein